MTEPLYLFSILLFTRAVETGGNALVMSTEMNNQTLTINNNQISNFIYIKIYYIILYNDADWASVLVFISM